MEKNRNIPIDQFFIDLKQYEGTESSTRGSWERMKHLLDKELPEDRHIAQTTFRKRYLLLLVLLFVAGASYLLADRYAYYGAANSRETSIATGSDNQHGGQEPSPVGNKSIGLTGAASTEKKNGAINSWDDSSARLADKQQNQAGRQALAYAEKAQEKLDAAHSRRPVVTSAQRPNLIAGQSRQTQLPTVPPTDPFTIGSRPPIIPEDTEAEIAATGREGISPTDVASSEIAKPSTPITEENLVEQLYPENAQANAEDREAGAVLDRRGDNSELTDNSARADDINKKTEGNQALATSPTPGKATAGSEDISPDWIPVNAADGSHEEIVRNKADGGYFKVDRDTFKRIEKQVSTVRDPADPSRRDFRVDTLTITRIERITYYPIAYPSPEFTEKRYATALVTNPAAGSGLASDYTLESASLVPLSSYKVASKKVKPTAFMSLKRTANGLESLFNGEKDWYMAILAGGHTSIGNPGSLGLQAGLAALYTFRERWVISAEARFMRSYFPGYKLLDASSNFEVSKSQVPGGWLYSGTETVTTNEYKLEQLSSLHVPVTLSYNFGRLSAFGGLDLSYRFPLKWEKESSFSTLPVAQLSTEDSNPFLDETFTLNEQKAFKSRLGLGYVAGLSYDFSRKLSLDLRIRQTVWDDAHYELDNLKRLYRRPSAELSLGFFFGRREKVIYIMDTHR